MAHLFSNSTLFTSQATAQYELTLYTSDIRGAGTDADVYLLISGDNGSSDEIKLYNGPQNFTRASTDKFTFTAKDVGSNKRLTFRLVSDAMGHLGEDPCRSDRSVRIQQIRADPCRWSQRTLLASSPSSLTDWPVSSLTCSLLLRRTATCTLDGLCLVSSCWTRSLA